MLIERGPSGPQIERLKIKDPRFKLLKGQDRRVKANLEIKIQNVLRQVMFFSVVIRNFAGFLFGGKYFFAQEVYG